MGDDLRDRFFTPFVLPVTIIGVMLLVGFSLSRVLLTVSELGAAFVALVAAGYILLAAFWIEARKRIPARSLGVALAIGLIGLVGAGAAASAAGMRDLEEHSASEESGAEGGGGEGGGETASTEPVFVAIDIEYESAPSELPTGDVDLTLENNGSIEHNVVIEELGDELILDAAGGETDEATVSLEAGEYTYYCSIPGHRATMEGTLTVSDDVEATSGASGGGGVEEPSEPGADTSEGASESASEG
jgi:plastocyanin